MTFSENFPEVALPTQVTQLCPAEYLQDLIVLNLLLKLTFVVSVPMVMRSEDVSCSSWLTLASLAEDERRADQNTVFERLSQEASNWKLVLLCTTWRKAGATKKKITSEATRSTVPPGNSGRWHKA